MARGQAVAILEGLGDRSGFTAVNSQALGRNVKRWRNAGMALRSTGAGMPEAEKGFRRLKACRQLPILRAALENHRSEPKADAVIDRQTRAA